jgi:hypothetical protein
MLWSGTAEDRNMRLKKDLASHAAAYSGKILTKCTNFESLGGRQRGHRPT